MRKNIDFYRMEKEKYNVFWFRRDLRLEDNKGLFHALRQQHKVLPVFIFDTTILYTLEKTDARVEFIYNSLVNIQQQLSQSGKNIIIRIGNPINIFNDLLKEYQVNAVYANRDHEPYGITRDKRIEGILKQAGIDFHLYTDHLLFSKNEVLRNQDTPYHIYTPYRKKALTLLSATHLARYPSEELTDNIAGSLSTSSFSYDQTGFVPSGIVFPSSTIDEKIIANYSETRDFPAVEGTSRLGVHLRFGTISIRKLAAVALKISDVFVSQLLWREFYAAILWHYPRVTFTSFKPQYENIAWRNNETEFEAWKQGQTGYPMVDAGMRQLSATGYMHNRVRMITSGFLTKHLLIDWRWGEAWFASKLLDFELSNNNGGWQWSAGCGCDAVPYFRIFNPQLQQQKFDPSDEYVKTWIPELNTPSYPTPIVDHPYARERCIRVFKSSLGQQQALI
jgi:deoxyribodipyrimidine photo-lyase